MAELNRVMILESIQINDDTYLRPLNVQERVIKEGKVIIDGQSVNLLANWDHTDLVALLENAENHQLFDLFKEHAERYYKLTGNNALEMVADDKIADIKKYFAVSAPFQDIAVQFIDYCKNGDQLKPFKIDLDIPKSNKPSPVWDFNIVDIYEYAKKYIVGQDEPLKAFIANLYLNCQINMRDYRDKKIVDLHKTILLTGFSGVGKTLMMKTIAQALKIPYVIEDITRYSKTAYEGQNIDAMFENLYHVAGDDLKMAEQGIIFIDEFDKCCNNAEDRGKITTVALQEALLKKIEGITFNLEMGSLLNRQKVAFDTSRVTFVLSGAFANLSRKNVTIDDEMLMAEGMVPELAGRISTFIKLNTPNKEDLKAFIQLPNGYFQSYLAFLKELGVEVTYDETIIDDIVEQAWELDLGYRGVKKVLEKMTSGSLYDSLTGNNPILKLKK